MYCLTLTYVCASPQIIICFVTLNINYVFKITMHQNNLVILQNYYYLQEYTKTCLYYHQHHQPINVPTAGAQAFLIDYT
jgi:hypothetical protein